MSQRLQRRKKKKLVVNHPEQEVQTPDEVEIETNMNTMQFFKIVGIITLVVLVLLYFMYSSSL